MALPSSQVLITSILLTFESKIILSLVSKDVFRVKMKRFISSTKHIIINQI